MILRNIFLSLLCLPSALTAHTGAPSLTKSLFFDETHIQEIQKMRGARLAQDSQEQANTLIYHLSGILFTSPAQWKLWINGKPYGPKTFPELRVTSVSATKASFVLKAKEKETPFTLHINEAYKASP